HDDKGDGGGLREPRGADETGAAAVALLHGPPRRRGRGPARHDQPQVPAVRALRQPGRRWPAVPQGPSQRGDPAPRYQPGHRRRPGAPERHDPVAGDLPRPPDQNYIPRQGRSEEGPAEGALSAGHGLTGTPQRTKGGTDMKLYWVVLTLIAI